jgi:hypothetical protein
MTDYDIRPELLQCLEYQRSSVRAIVEGHLEIAREFLDGATGLGLR